MADINGRLDHRKWEQSAALYCRHLWLTDCESCSSALQKVKSDKVTDKRLGIEFEALRQTLWRGLDGKLVDPRLLDSRPLQTTDRSRWVDTRVMLADPLTKVMDSERLMIALSTDLLDFVETEEYKA